jgi:hypothetical protein
LRRLSGLLRDRRLCFVVAVVVSVSLATRGQADIRGLVTA